MHKTVNSLSIQMLPFSSGMFLSYTLLSTLCLLLTFTSSSKEGAGLYTNEFAVKIPGGHQVAKDVARRLGFTFIDQVLYEQRTLIWKSTRSEKSHTLH